MPRYCLTPDRLFDRPWRPGHPFRPKMGRARQVGMLALFGLLCAVIAAYNVLTDAGRVRGMAESYLSELIGARVTVGKANLSLFEGMRLDNVRVYVNDEPDGTTGPSLPAA